MPLKLPLILPSPLLTSLGSHTPSPSNRSITLFLSLSLLLEYPSTFRLSLEMFRVFVLSFSSCLLLSHLAFPLSYSDPWISSNILLDSSCVSPSPPSYTYFVSRNSPLVGTQLVAHLEALAHNLEMFLPDFVVVTVLESARTACRNREERSARALPEIPSLIQTRLQHDDLTISAFSPLHCCRECMRYLQSK